MSGAGKAPHTWSLNWSKQAMRDRLTRATVYQHPDDEDPWTAWVFRAGELHDTGYYPTHAEAIAWADRTVREIAQTGDVK